MNLPSPQIDPPIAALLTGLSRGIRSYVWTQGVALALVVLGLAFWLSLGFDWSVEPPIQVRGLLLVAVAALCMWVVYHYIIRRAFVPFSDHHLALLIERRFPEFHDSLVTAVELAGQSHELPPLSVDMLSNTRQMALAHTSEVRLAHVFRWRPILWQVLAAATLLLSVVGFCWANGTAFRVWRDRAFLLSDEPWPRRTGLEVSGFDRPVKVARGSDLEVRVRATGEIPETVEFRYFTPDGARGRENMTREGRAEPDSPDGQMFAYTIKAIASPMRFDILGGDNRVRNLQIEVVENPALVDMTLHCEFPEYLHRPPRDLPVTGLMQLPRGTQISVSAAGNKNLQEVPIHRLVGDKTESVAVIHFADAASPRKFSFELGTLLDDQTLLFSILDADGIRSREPVRLSLSAKPDEPRKVALRLRGIGTSITSEARLPVDGEITDDYGVAGAWWEYSIKDAKPAAKDAAKNGPEGAETAAVKPKRQQFQAKFSGREAEKFGRERDEALDLRDWKLEPGQKLLVQVKAQDTYALETQPNVGAGEQVQLDIVRPDQLLSILNARELALRRRFESIIEDVTKSRDALASVKFDEQGTPAKSPAEKPDKGADPEDAAPLDKKKAVDEPEDKSAAGEGAKAKTSGEFDDVAPKFKRLIAVQRGVENSDRSGAETTSLANAFDDLVDEVLNNRLDTRTPELVSRLRDQIAAPLHQIGEQRFTNLLSRLRKLEAEINGPSASVAGQQSAAVKTFDAILVEMSQVLDKMLALETFNELVERLRAIQEAQARLNEQTSRRQKEQARKKLEE